MKKLVVLTGAGVSAESGIQTFRDSGGLWEGYSVYEVATPEAWRADREKVLEFYNMRRRAAVNVEPNRAHLELAELESHFDVHVITQNIDDLHERAGSSKILHLHGSLFESRSTLDPNLVYKIEGTELNVGDMCEKGSQLRPNVVWFGEMVPAMEEAAIIAATADFFLVIGTSLVVYPAAGLIDMVGSFTPKFVVDPNLQPLEGYPQLTQYSENASTGILKVKEDLLRALD